MKPFSPDAYGSFLEWATRGVDSFIGRLIPAPRFPVREALFERTCELFVHDLVVHGITPPDPTCLTDPALAAQRDTYLAHLLGAALVALTEYQSSLPCVAPVQSFDPRQRWREHWPELSEESRVALAYWLLENPRYQAALCLRYELEIDKDAERSILQCRNSNAADQLVDRARKAFRGQYTRLVQMNSPPFPDVFCDVFDDRRRDDVEWPPEKQQILVATFSWLRQELQ
jgi:hypothetical protein